MKTDITLVCARCGAWWPVADVDVSSKIKLYRIARSYGWELRLNEEVFCPSCKSEEELKWIPKHGRR